MFTDDDDGLGNYRRKAITPVSSVTRQSLLRHASQFLGGTVTGSGRLEIAALRAIIPANKSKTPATARYFSSQA
jgi:hypothetical protein